MTTFTQAIGAIHRLPLLTTLAVVAILANVGSLKAEVISFPVGTPVQTIFYPTYPAHLVQRGEYSFLRAWGGLLINTQNTGGAHPGGLYVNSIPADTSLVIDRSGQPFSLQNMSVLERNAVSLLRLQVFGVPYGGGPTFDAELFFDLNSSTYDAFDLIAVDPRFASITAAYVRIDTPVIDPLFAPYIIDALTVAPVVLGDANGDGCVSGADFTVWGDHFGAGPGATTSDGDFTADGFVTGADFTVWADHYGEGCAPSAVPEPDSAWLLLGALLGACGWWSIERRRALRSSLKERRSPWQDALTRLAFSPRWTPGVNVLRRILLVGCFAMAARFADAATITFPPGTPVDRSTYYDVVTIGDYRFSGPGDYMAIADSGGLFVANFHGVQMTRLDGQPFLLESMTFISRPYVSFPLHWPEELSIVAFSPDSPFSFGTTIFTNTGNSHYFAPLTVDLLDEQPRLGYVDEVWFLEGEPFQINELIVRIPGDANRDDLVSGADFTIWNDHYGVGPGALPSVGDFNADGYVTGADFTIWADHFGQTATTVATIPEPGSAILAALGGLLAMVTSCRRWVLRGAPTVASRAARRLAAPVVISTLVTSSTIGFTNAEVITFPVGTQVQTIFGTSIYQLVQQGEYSFSRLWGGLSINTQNSGGLHAGGLYVAGGSDWPMAIGRGGQPFALQSISASERNTTTGLQLSIYATPYGGGPGFDVELPFDLNLTTYDTFDMLAADPRFASITAAYFYVESPFVDPVFGPYVLDSATVVAPVQGDANGDGCVSGADFTIWNDHYGAGPGATVSVGDFTADGYVTGADFTVWADHFGEGCAPSSVPEPPSVIFFVLAAAIAPLRSRRRLRLMTTTAVGLLSAAWAPNAEAGYQVGPNPNVGIIGIYATDAENNDDPFINQGYVTVHAGGVLTNYGEFNSFDAARVTVEIGGAIVNYANWINDSDTISSNAGTITNFGKLKSGGFSFTNSGSLVNKLGGELFNDHFLWNLNSLVNEGYMLNSDLLQNSAPLVNAAGAEFVSTGHFTQYNTFINRGSFWNRLPSVPNGVHDGEVYNYGTIDVPLGGSIRNQYRFNAIGNLTHAGDIINDSYGVWINTGTMTTHAGATFTNGVAGQVLNSGTWTVDGTFSHQGYALNNGAVMVLNGVMHNSTTMTNLGSLTIGSTGRIDGPGTFTSSGTILVHGQLAAAAIAMTGAAHLAGALALELSPGWSAPAGTVLDLLTAASVDGTFAIVSGTVFGTGPGTFLAPLYDATRVRLYVPLLGDANLDGIVSGADFTLWGDHFGTGPGATWSQGDFTGDGLVTGGDFTIWADHFGQSAVDAVSVPEPDSASMLLGALLGAGGWWWIERHRAKPEFQRRSARASDVGWSGHFVEVSGARSDKRT